MGQKQVGNILAIAQVMESKHKQKCSRCEGKKQATWILVEGTKHAYRYLCTDCGIYMYDLFLEFGWNWNEIYKEFNEDA